MIRYSCQSIFVSIGVHSWFVLQDEQTTAYRSSVPLLQDRAEHGDGVVPELAADGPIGNLFRGNDVRLCQIFVLPLAYDGSQLRVAEEDVVFIVEIKTAAVHVGGTDQGDLTVDRKRLRVQQTSDILVNLDARLQ